METTSKPQFVLIPWLAPSHIIPMVDIGCLLAAHGAPVTVITTPASSPLVQSRVDRAASQAAVITVTTLPFPAAEAGLPEGCERIDHIPSHDMVPCFFKANELFGEVVVRYFRSTAPRRADCVIAGTCHSWALGMAHELGAPCFIFHGYGAFALLCCEHLYTHKPHEAVSSIDDIVDVSVLPPFESKFARRQLPSQFLPYFHIGGGTMQEMRQFEMAADGIVVNSFEELELGSAALLAAATGKKVLTVGPVSLCYQPSLDSQASDEARRCIAWLDAKKAKSVVYVSFGSAGCMPPVQLLQLGMALVSCPWPVLWVVKGADLLSDDIAKWLRENTDADGIADSKCLVVRGWAPQVAILAHAAVGGFMTHCGWGSTLESIAAGMPMATWPFFAEQFLNEKLIVDVLGVGVSVGVTKPTKNILTSGSGQGGGVEAEAEVGMEQVKRALERLMDGGAGGEERRRKAQELKAKAKAALENGGSSFIHLEKLIQSFT